MTVIFTHQVGDGLHSAIVKARKPADVPTGPQAGRQPTASSRALPLVDQQGR